MIAHWEGSLPVGATNPYPWCMWDTDALVHNVIEHSGVPVYNQVDTILIKVVVPSNQKQSMRRYQVKHKEH